MENLQICKTPGTPSYELSSVTDENQKIDKENPKVVSMLIRHRDAALFRQTLIARNANTVCKCTKVLDGATTYTYCEMLHIIKYTLSTKDYGLKIDPTHKKDKLLDTVC